MKTDQSSIKTVPVPVNGLQKEWIHRACDLVDEQELVELIIKMVNIPSFPGQERALAEFMVDYLNGKGIASNYQAIDHNRGNAIGRVKGNGSGPDLLFYGQLDMGLGGPGDREWIGEGRADFESNGIVQGRDIIGLGAENPKGNAACAVIAVEAIKRAGIPLKGDIILGLVAGGMPIMKPDTLPNAPANLGHGVGIEHMLRYGVRSDYAIIAKPGWTVAWEEPGLCWFKITVKGTLAYAGSRHINNYSNPIVTCAKVILELEEWLKEYPGKHSQGTISPQGVIGAIRGGWPERPTFVPALTKLYVDLRISPDTDPLDAFREFDKALQNISLKYSDIILTSEMIVSIPGSRTDPSNWIVQSCVRAWEEIEGESYVPPKELSGVTDWNILRAWGIPVARIGMVKPKPMEGKPFFSMGRANIDSALKVVKAYIHAAIDTCTRERDEIELLDKEMI